MRTFVVKKGNAGHIASLLKQCLERRMSCYWVFVLACCVALLSSKHFALGTLGWRRSYFVLCCKWQGDGNTSENHLRGLFTFFPLLTTLYVSRGRVLDWELEHNKKDASWKKRERRRVGGFLYFLSCTGQADLDSKCQIEKQLLWTGPTRTPSIGTLYSQ